MTTANSPLPGDYGVVRTKGFVGAAIRVVTRSKYNHAFVYMDADTCVEAQPGGAVKDSAGYPPANVERSHMTLTEAQRTAICAAATTLVGTPYGFLDILSIGALQYGIKPAFVRRRVARSDQLICSQLVDEAYRRAGVHLFSDGRLPMDVTPGDLARLIESS